MSEWKKARIGKMRKITDDLNLNSFSFKNLNGFLIQKERREFRFKLGVLEGNQWLYLQAVTVLMFTNN